MNSEIRNGVLYLSGDITVKTVNAAAHSRFEQQCRLKDISALDLGEVGRADSACISLLLAALRHRPEGLAFHRLPDTVRALAELYEINDWIKS